MGFGGGSDKSSREMVNMQKQEAAQARQKEVERQARIDAGLARIKGMFRGTPVMKDVARSFQTTGPAAGTTSGTAVSGLPAGYTYVQQDVPAAATAAATKKAAPAVNYGGQSGHGGSYQVGGKTGTYGGQSGHGGGGQTAATPAAATKKWMVQGPDGRLYEVGQNIGYTGQEDTGQTTGGFGDAFYNKYRQGIIDYYMPQVAKEYGKAQDETLFRLARAGTTKSTAANEAFADLTGQNVKQQEKVKSQADTAAGELKTRVAGEEQKAINQLYATENPDVAANTATAAVKNISAEDFDKTPLSDIFNIATIGTAGALGGYQNQKYRQQIPGAQKSTSIV